MKTGASYYKDQPLNIVGSSIFGRYPKMSSERTYNMIISDNYLVPFGGYRAVRPINNTGEGRGIFASESLGRMYPVIDNDIFQLDANLTGTVIGRTETLSGDVYIAENNAGQVAFSDSLNIYIYDTRTNVFTTLTSAQLGFQPGYLTFQDGRFISPDLKTNQFRLSDFNNGLSWPFDAQHVGEVSTKASRCLACIRFPGKGNLLAVFGGIVGEFWTDVGAQLFPYQRSQSANIDYGLLNASTLAGIENMICWLGGNEQSGPVIMMSNGIQNQRISTDGIDFEFAQLKNPRECYGFMVRVDGHPCYVITFTKDNVTYLYDFTTQKFFNLCDENMDAFIVKRIAFFNDRYYFVSIRDGNLYELNAKYFDYVYTDKVKEVPCIRVCSNIRNEAQSNFTVGYAGFTIQQGDFTTKSNATNRIPRVDFSMSKDAGENYSSNVAKVMFPQGKRQNKLMWRGLGMANDMTPQFRFHGLTGRFVVTDGVVGVRD